MPSGSSLSKLLLTLRSFKVDIKQISSGKTVNWLSDRSIYYSRVLNMFTVANFNFNPDILNSDWPLYDIWYVFLLAEPIWGFFSILNFFAEARSAPPPMKESTGSSLERVSRVSPAFPPGFKSSFRLVNLWVCEEKSLNCFYSEGNDNMESLSEPVTTLLLRL